MLTKAGIIVLAFVKSARPSLELNTAKHYSQVSSRDGVGSVNA
jgi:hypothetical protein